ncbi:hypothetical protein FB451DRAFT_1027811 [Mycena latifolia]|nr:hypothetical protein FB451DRAFT_1027811 [Mycena latifolia]
MSDDESGTKATGFRVGYAASNRSKCKGQQPRSLHTAIEMGELRLGSIKGKSRRAAVTWRHWDCVSEKLLSHAKKLYDEVNQLKGFEDLDEADQARVTTAWEEGRVADEDIHESAPGTPQDADDDEDKQKETADGEDYGDEEAKPQAGVTPQVRIVGLYYIYHSNAFT